MEIGSQQPLPNGSPFLAYGTSRGPAINRKILALIAGIFVFGLIVIGAILFPPIQLPEKTFLMATVRSHTKLPNGSPQAWSVASQSGFPSILGMMMTDSGPRPFAVTLFSAPQTALRTERDGVFVFISDTPIDRLHSTQAVSLSEFFSKTFSAPVYFRITPSVFASEIEGVIDGPIRDGVWQTNISISATSPTRLPNSDAAIDLRAFPEAWSPVQNILSKSGILFDTIDLPSAVGWDVTTGTPSTIDLLYEDKTPTSTILELASQVGLSDTYPYTLPDNEVITELREPISLLSATDTRSWTGEYGTIQLTNDGIRITQSGASTIDQLPQTPCAPGQHVLTLGRPLLQNIFQQTGMSVFLSIDRIDAYVEQRRLFVCLP